jgi:regulator of RNase E activity RraA
MSTSSQNANLSQYSSCEISDALVKLGLPHGGHIPDIHMLSPSTSNTKICAPAYTVKMVLSSNKTAPKLSEHFVDTAPAGSIIVMDAPPRSVLFSSPCSFHSLAEMFHSPVQKPKVPFGVVS